MVRTLNSALHVPGFLLAHRQRQVYKRRGSSLVGMLSAPGSGWYCASTFSSACEDGLKESPKHVRQK
jgi:hypothetical protein